MAHLQSQTDQRFQNFIVGCDVGLGLICLQHPVWMKHPSGRPWNTHAECVCPVCSVAPALGQNGFGTAGCQDRYRTGQDRTGLGAGGSMSDSPPRNTNIEVTRCRISTNSHNTPKYQTVGGESRCPPFEGSRPLPVSSRPPLPHPHCSMPHRRRKDLVVGLAFAVCILAVAQGTEDCYEDKSSRLGCLRELFPSRDDTALQVGMGRGVGPRWGGVVQVAFFSFFCTIRILGTWRF